MKWFRAVAVGVPVAAAIAAGLAAMPTAGAHTDAGDAIVGIDGKCVDVQWAQTRNGTPIHLWDCNGTGAQRWTVAGAPGPVRAFGKCLDVIGGGTGDGTPVQLFDCNGSGAQVWQAANGRLINPASGKCLDSPGGSATGTHLRIGRCTGSQTQRWRVPRAVAPAADAAPADRMIELINVERTKAGCPPVVRDDRLTAAAHEHSRRMAERRELSHRLPGEPELGDRITATGYRWGGAAENAAPGAFTTPEIAMYGRHDATADFTGFMESPGHRDNILNCGLRDVGVGVVRDAHGGPWWTQVFASPL